jgi:hypothetical protein
LLVDVAGEMVTVQGDGDFPLTTTNAMTPLVQLVQPGASQVDDFHCVAQLLPASIVVRCLGAVRPVHPSFANWLNYVIAGSETPCLNQPGQVCEHGAELRVAQLYDQTSCDGMVANDSARLLEWVCEPSGDHIAFRSTGIRPRSGLSSVIEFGTCTTEDAPCVFKDMALTITEGTAQRSSASEQWWQNTIIRNDAGTFAPTGVTGSIMVAGGATLPALESSLISSNVAVVLVPGTVAELQPFAVNGNQTWLEGGALGVTGLAQATDAFISVVGSRVTLRNLDLAGGHVYVGETIGGKLADLRIRNSQSYGIRLGNESGDFETSETILQRITIQDVTSAGIFAEALQVSTIEDVRVAYAEYGLQFGGTFKRNERVRVRRVFVTNTFDYAVFATNLQSSSLVDITTVDNVGGVSLGFSTQSIFLANVTSAHNSSEQIQVSGSDNVAANTLVVNSDRGLYTNGALSVQLHDFAAFAVTGPLVNVYMSPGFKAPRIEGLASYVPGPSGFVCSVSADVAATCTTTGTAGSSDWPCPSGPSGSCDAVLTAMPAQAPFVGFVTRESVNPAFQPGNGQTGADVASVPNAQFAYTSFESPRRSWVTDPNLDTYPNASHRGGCAEGRCSVFDWRPLGGGPLNDTLPLPTASEALSTIVFRDSMPPPLGCAVEYPGSVSDTDVSQAVCRTTYLPGAVEIDHDGIGTDNGMCEAGDDCLVSVNWGADQGEGPLVSLGNVVVGTGTARLFRFSKTGY